MSIKASLLAMAMLVGTWVLAQSEAIPLPSFDKIVASQFVRVILEQGEQESIRLEYSGVNPEDVNFRVRGKKLRIYLDDARLVEKQRTIYENGYRRKVSRYGNVQVTAYITYKTLRAIDIRGEQGLTCNGPIEADKFKLNVYGEHQVHIASVNAKKFKASIFGANNIMIKSGEAGHQVYRVFGENKIDTENLLSNTTSSRIYGVGTLTLNANDELRITAFGEPEIRLRGGAHINKSLILGNADIRVKR